MLDMDWDRAWDETFDLVRSIFFPKKNSGPPDWWKKMDETPLKPMAPNEAAAAMAAYDRLEAEKRLSEPGAMALDVVPKAALTEEEHQEAARHWSDKGYTYRRPDLIHPTDVPKGTLILPTK
jgi:hypothetical protein